MRNSPTLATDWVLSESAGSTGSEEDFVLWSCGNGTGPKVRAVSGAAALLEVLRRSFSRLVILDFQVSFQRGLSLLQAMKAAAPETEILVCVTSPRSTTDEPLHFSVDLRSSGVSLHRVVPGEQGREAPRTPKAG